MGGRKGKKGAPAAPHPESAAVPNGQEATDKTRAKPRSRRTKAPAPMANEDARNQDNRQPPRRQAANSPESQSAAHDVGQHMQADINVSNARRAGRNLLTRCERFGNVRSNCLAMVYKEQQTQTSVQEMRLIR